MATTTKQYLRLDDAYRFFNTRLFNGKLPECLITLQRKSKAMGYFSPDRFVSTSGKEKTHELALNPMFFNQPEKEVLQTLVHEMCHVWQKQEGTMGRMGYHNSEWADKMESIGLMPSSTGKPEGDRTGQKMSDYIIDAGPFDTASDELLKKNVIQWRDIVVDSSKTVKAKKKNKIKYTCPSCDANAWGKPELNIICGDCDSQMRAE